MIQKSLLIGFVLAAVLFTAFDSTDSSDNQSFVTVNVTGGGPVVRILAAPATFADSAQSSIAKFPSKVQQRFKKVAESGPFTNNTVQISGDFSITMTDNGDTGDKVDGTANFTTKDGTTWRYEFDSVNPNGMPPHAPHFGGVVTDFVFHGPTALHTPLEPLVQSEASMWGFARVFRNGDQIKDKAPFYIMLTSQIRDENFNYICYTCAATNKMEEVHLISRTPDQSLYDTKGGFIHVVWQKSTFKRVDP